MKVNGKLVKDDPEFMSIFDQELNPELNLDKGITIGSTRRLRYRKPDGSIAEVSIGHLYRAKQRSSSGTFDEYIGRPLRRAVNDDPEFMSIFDPELNPDIAGNLHRITTASRRSLKYRGSNGAINAIGIAHLYSIRGRFGTLSCCLEQHERHYAKDDPEFMSIFDPELNPDLAKDLDSITTGVNRKIRFRLPDGEICERTIEQLFRLKKKWGDFSHMRTKKRKHVKDDPEFMLLFDPALNPDLTDRIKKLTTGSKVKIRYRCNGAIMEASIYSLYQAKRRTGDFYKHRCVKRKPPVTDDAEFMNFLDRDLNPELLKDIDRITAGTDRIIRYRDLDGFVRECPISELFALKKQGRPFESLRNTTQLLSCAPELRDYIVSDLSYVAKHRPTSLLKVECVCPLCGAHFTKSISALVTGLYKCPACHDTGVDERKMVEGNFYLI